MDSLVALGYLVAPVPIGTTLQRSYVVDGAMLTHHVPARAPVLMTPNLVALLEDASAEIVRPLLTPGSAAVGTWVGIHHTGIARLAETVDVTTVVREVAGRRITFDVTARVGDRPVGHGDIAFTFVASPPPRS
jgi:predicted thioesterase